MIKNQKLYETRKYENLKELVEETVKLYPNNNANPPNKIAHEPNFNVKYLFLFIHPTGNSLFFINEHLT